MSQPVVRGFPRGHSTIGYLSSGIHEENSLAIWSGMVEVARANDVNVLCFLGGQLRDPAGFNSQANAIYDLVDRGRLDGLVIWTSSLSSYVGPEAIQAFCERFRPLPMVSLGMTLPGMPNIVLDSYGGMHAIVGHLIETHGRRRVAFIRGPLTHQEATDRYRAYIDALAEHDLPFDPDLVSPPYSWNEHFGSQAAELFLEERHARFDALAAVNDRLALGTLHALQAHGLRVPEDVAVTGFDNRNIGRIAMPSLTTVPIHMHERGRQASQMLLALMSGKDVPAEVVLPTRPLFRQSCGCPDAAVEQAATAPAPIALSSRPAELSPQPPATERLGSVRQRTLFEMAGAFVVVDEPPGPVADLFDAFVAELNGQGAGLFMRTLERLLREGMQARKDVSAWQGVVSALRRSALLQLPAASPVLGQAESLWQQARVLIGEWIWRAQASDEWRANQQADKLHTLSRAMAVAGNLTGLMDVLALELPEMGIASCYIALYEEPRHPTDWCKLILAYDARGRLPLPEDGRRVLTKAFASGSLLPDTQRNSMIIWPLYYGDEHLGLLMLDGSGCDGQTYLELQAHISSALKGILLLEENVRLYHQALRAEQAALEGQRVAEEANRLKSRFLSVVSHELLTPLVLVVGLSEMLLRDSPGGRPALPEPYRQDLARIHAGAQQLGGLVRDVLDLARSEMGQLKLSKKPIDLGTTLKPVILVGEQMARGKGLEWSVDIAPDLPTVIGDPMRLQQVALNLVTNAVKFTAHGYVRLSAEAGPEVITVSVSDSGLGVAPEEQEAIFDEFHQSERTAARGHGGLGVGLAICRQLVTLHGGEIGVRSSGEEDGGSTFFFTIPATRGTSVAGSDPSLPSQTVLVLTEHTEDGERVRTYLSQEGFQTELLVVGAGDAWLPQVLAMAPGAIVLDLLPTSERGWQLVGTLKQHPSTQEIPVLFYSFLEERDTGAVLSLDWQAKPMGGEALVQSLQRLGLEGIGRQANRTILIVDDDPDVLELHTRIVREHLPDCDVLTAENGRQALAVMRTVRPALVLLDLVMPELDGAGVLDAMHADRHTQDIPVIILTAQSLTEEDMDRLNHSVAAVLEKGVFTAEETLAHIEQTLARNKRLGSEAQRLVRKAMAYIHEHYAEAISREDIAAYAAVSPRHLTRCFTQEIGVAPIDYLNRYRVAQAERLLNSGDASLTEVMGAVGFTNSSYFARVFRREVGVSPSAYLRGVRPSSS